VLVNGHSHRTLDPGIEFARQGIMAVEISPKAPLIRSQLSVKGEQLRLGVFAAVMVWRVSMRWLCGASSRPGGATRRCKRASERAPAPITNLSGAVSGTVGP
jgi:hypothetical protein